MADDTDKTVSPTTPPAERMAPPAGEHAEHGPEQDLWRGRGDWRYQIGSILLFFLVSIAIVCVVEFFIIGQNKNLNWTARWVAAIVIAAWGLKAIWNVVMHVYQTRYRLTTERLFIDRGILSRTTDQIELIRVDDVRVRQRLLDRLFLIGSIDILSTDVSDAKTSIIGIQKPDEVAEHIRSHMRSLRKKSLFIENL